MRYQVASVKDVDGKESVLIYAVDRADALNAVQGLFTSDPVVLGEVDGSQLLQYCVSFR